jgi:hypothetical protein
MKNLLLFLLPLTNCAFDPSKPSNQKGTSEFELNLSSTPFEFKLKSPTAPVATFSCESSYQEILDKNPFSLNDQNFFVAAGQTNDQPILKVFDQNKKSLFCFDSLPFNIKTESITGLGKENEWLLALVSHPLKRSGNPLDNKPFLTSTTQTSESLLILNLKTGQIQKSLLLDGWGLASSLEGRKVLKIRNEPTRLIFTMKMRKKREKVIVYKENWSIPLVEETLNSWHLVSPPQYTLQRPECKRKNHQFFVKYGDTVLRGRFANQLIQTATRILYNDRFCLDQIKHIGSSSLETYFELPRLEKLQPKEIFYYLNQPIQQEDTLVYFEPEDQRKDFGFFQKSYNPFKKIESSKSLSILDWLIQSFQSPLKPKSSLPSHSLDGYLNLPTHVYASHMEIWSSIRIKDSLRDFFETQLEHLKEKHQLDGFVVLHVRRGDLLKYAFTWQYPVPWSWYEESLKDFEANKSKLKFIQNKRLGYYIATDSPSKVLPFARASINSPFVFSEKDLYLNQSEELLSMNRGDLAVIFDFLMLTKGDVVLASNSSFSTFGTFLNHQGHYFRRPNLEHEKLIAYNPRKTEILFPSQGSGKRFQELIYEEERLFSQSN